MTDDAPASSAALPAPGEPILSVRGLNATYRVKEARVAAVRDLDLDLHRGRTLALVGESGAGKSTVALAILHVLPSGAEMSGEVVFDGVALGGLPAEELRRVRGAEIALILQDAHSALSPSLRVGEQVAELFEAHSELSRSEAKEAAVETLARVLPDARRVADSFPFQLSGGMAQRVLIAMATALEPRVIIADEPTASQDPAVSSETLSALERMRDEGQVALLLITHDLSIVARLADEVAVMYAGRIVERTDVRTFFSAPLHPYAYGLLSSLPEFAPERRPGERSRLRVMPGQPPDLSLLPPQCAFLPRCQKAVSRCRTEDAPALEPAGPGHEVACFNPMVVPLERS